MSQDQDDLIRERAYAIWQAEGCPDGRHEQHWLQASADLSQARAEAAQGGEPAATGEPIVTPRRPGAAGRAAKDKTQASSTPRSRTAADAASAPSKGRRGKGAEAQGAS